MQSPIGRLHRWRHLLKSISQWHLFPHLLRKCRFSLLSSSFTSPPPFHFITFNFIDHHVDKKQLEAQIYMWELLTLHVKCYWVHLMTILRFPLKGNYMGRSCTCWLQALHVRGSSLTNWQIIIISVWVDIEMHRAISSRRSRKTLLEIIPC